MLRSAYRYWSEALVLRLEDVGEKTSNSTEFGCRTNWRGRKERENKRTTTDRSIDRSMRKIPTIFLLVSTLGAARLLLREKGKATCFPRGGLGKQNKPLCTQGGKLRGVANAVTTTTTTTDTRSLATFRRALARACLLGEKNPFPLAAGVWFDDEDGLACTSAVKLRPGWTKKQRKLYIHRRGRACRRGTEKKEQRVVAILLGTVTRVGLN